MSKYLILLILSGALPFVLSLYRPLKFYKNFKALFYSIGLIVVIFGIWDIFATHRGHWSFSPEGVGGLHLLNLPLEEVLFFIVIPFCCILTWELLYYIKGRLR